MSKATAQLPWYRRWSWSKFVKRTLVAVFLTTVVALGLLHWRLRSSLPQLDGTLDFESLASEVTIERDAAGVPTITSNNRADAAFGLGFVHAQERFFQMDLLRRVSSGRLSEILGERLLGVDEMMRKHRFQEVAKAVVQEMPAKHQEMFDAYCRGVNAGIGKLQAAPIEYTVLQSDPAPWTKEDSIYVMLSMLVDLQPMDGRPELALAHFHESVPQEVFDFLVRPGSTWDAALDGSTFDPPPIPPADLWSLRESQDGDTKDTLTASEAAQQHKLTTSDHPLLSRYLGRDESVQPGSNNWAVSSKVGKDGRAILASDMHLGLRVPVIWFRSVIHTPCLDGIERRLVGVTLPGLPALVEGSNGEVAWGMTNNPCDFGDIIELKMVPEDSGKYMTPQGPKEIETIRESIQVGSATREIEYEWSAWGPVVETDGERVFVHRWIGDDPAAIDTRLFDLETATSAEHAVEISSQAGAINLNVVVADNAGEVGWTVCGRIPKRAKSPPRTFQDWSTKEQWLGYVDPNQYPKVLAPEDGRVWTANNRVVGGDGMQLLGDGTLSRGGRAFQIRKRLFEKDKFSEEDLLAIQLDDEALFLSRWHELLKDVLKRNQTAASAEFAAEVEEWKGRAGVDSVGYRIVRSFRENTIEIFFGRGIDRPDVEGRIGAVTQKAQIYGGLPPLSLESTVWDLLTQQPTHWLPSQYETWEELLLSALDSTERKLTAESNIADATWGKRNQAKIAHPVLGAIPLIGNWVNMPTVALPGGRNTPRVQTPSFGASERMVVSPGHEEQGIYHQPGGQSGHPYSPYYRTGFRDWCEGNPSQLMPGPAKYKLSLRPAPR